jgi:hypothetical protein
MKKTVLLVSVAAFCATCLFADRRTYRQTVELTYGSPEEAARARLDAQGATRVYSTAEITRPAK